MYFRDGPDPMCRSTELTLYSHSSELVLLEGLRPLDADVRTFEVEFASDWVWVWRGCRKVVDACISGAWDT